MAEKRRSFTKAERERVYKKYGGHCAYCGKEISIREMQVDHLTPLYSWNGTGGTNNMENLMPSCRSCNHYKSTYDLETFRTCLERIPAVLERDKPTFRIAESYGLIKKEEKHVTFYFEKDIHKTVEVGKTATSVETYAYQETPIHCPFCVGNNKNAVLCGDERNREYFVFCEICGIETKESYRRKETAIAAFAAKKTRKIEGDKGNA